MDEDWRKISLDPPDDWMTPEQIALSKKNDKFLASLHFLPLRWRDLNSMEFTETKWRIKNLIPWEGLVILSAIPGGKKTWIGMEMARSMCQGINFVGAEQFPVIKSKVLYIDCENSKSEIQRRGRQLGLKEDDDFFILSMDSLNLNNDGEIAKLTELVEKERIGAIFVDTFRAVANSLKEEKAEEVRGFFNRFKHFKDKGVAVVFLDHFRKPNNFDGKVPKKEFLIGSTDKTASVEVLLMLSSEDGSSGINVYQRKNRLGREVSPFRVSMIDEEKNGTVFTRLKFEEEIADEVNKKEEAKELVYSLLEGSEGLGTKQILSTLQKQVGSKNIRGALGEMVKEGLLKVGRSGRQNFYSLPKEGEWLEPEEESLSSPENNNFSGP